MSESAFEVPKDQAEGLAKAFQQIGLTAQKAIERGLIAGGIVVQDAATRLVPVKTGNLRRSIDKTEPETTLGITEVFVGTNVEYAPMVEFGSADGKRKPKPYLQPALEMNLLAVQRLVAESMRVEAEKDLNNG